MEISLSKYNWEVTGHWPFVPLKETSMELGQKLRGVTPPLPAVVPGGVHYDAYRAGLIDNPWYGTDSLKCEWIENRWWLYRTSFDCAEADGKRAELKLKGLDYEAMVFLNDVLLGEHKGMYEPFTADVTGVLRKNGNTLIVILKGVPDEMGQIGHTSMTSTQKSRFNYKWDFSTHLVNIGIWQDVVLKLFEDVELEEFFVKSGYDGTEGSITAGGRLTGEMTENSAVRLRVLAPETKQIVFDESINETDCFKADPADGTETAETESFCKDNNNEISFLKDIKILTPELWYPNGYGGQPLYTVQILAEERVLAEKQIGIRSISYEQNAGAPADSLPYTFVVNGKKLYIRGMNITPLDHLYGNVTDGQYEFLVDTAVNAHVNLLRVWGGGLIEKEILYDLCDRKGVLIWQEFIQSSSGIDNKPCEEPEFLELLKRNSAAAIREKRSHTCLAVWSGGNELTETENRPCGYENKNIAMLKELVEQYDPDRLFLPTSASGPREFMSFENGVFTETGVTHDVHGGWNYGGNPGHYLKYEGSDHLFHSEYGMDGTTSMKSIRKFMPPADQYPTTMGGNPRWMHHGDWWGTYYRDTEMFGPVEDLKLFTDFSRYMQAEGLRYIVEANTRKAFRCSGSIIWQLNEPWPNICCTNLLDYYGETKPAYYAVKRAYAGRHISMPYRKLDYTAGEEFVSPIWISNTEEKFSCRASAKVRRADGSTLYETDFCVDVYENEVKAIGELRFAVPEEEVFFVDLRLGADGAETDRNVYLFSTRKEHLFEPLRRMNPAVERKILACEEEAGRKKLSVLLVNTGDCAAVNVGVELTDSTSWMIADENYVTLFPGEEKELTLHVRPKTAGGFLAEENHRPGEPLSCDLTVEWLGKPEGK